MGRSSRIFLILALLAFLGCATSSEQQFERRDKYRIDRRCLASPATAKLLEAGIRRAFDEGLACLRELASDGKPEIEDELQDLLNYWGYVDISCPENYDRDGTLAQAQAYHYSSGVRPQIWLNLKSLNRDPEHRKMVAGTIFHELLHHPGYDHVSTIDYAFACEFHCFPPQNLSWKKFEKEGKEGARRICGGEFKDPDDFEYLREMNNLFLIFEHQSKLTTNRNHAAVLRHPKRMDLKLLLGRFVLETYAWPMASQLMLLMEKRYEGHKTSAKEKEWILHNREILAKNKIPSEFRKPAQLLAQAYLAFYDGEFVKAEELLDKYKLPLRAVTMRPKNFEYMNAAFEIVHEILKRSLLSDRESLTERL